MGEETVTVFFCTPDTQFAEIIATALGPEFNFYVEDSLELMQARGWQACDVALLDLRGAEEPGAPRLDLIDQIRRSDLAPPVIGMAGDDSRASTRSIFERGAHDAVTFPPDIAELRLVLRRAGRFRQVENELRALREGVRGDHPGDFVVSSQPMRELLALTKKIAPCDVTAMITGETGTGKELLAREIHRLSLRADGPFVAFSCANLPESLIEDELFGHEKGAFTGAVSMRRGRLELAHHGTLFLDEIGDLALGLQAKLLRVLQQRSFERLGSNTPVNVDFRLVCATHRNLQQMIEKGEFRLDLYYRLNVVQLQVPPLRDRCEGILALAHYFLRRYAQQFGKPVERLSPLSARAIEEHNWPGNVRELENAIQRAVAVAEGPAIEVWHLPSAVCKRFEPQARVLRSYEEEVYEFKRRLLLRTLAESKGNKAEAAKALGIARGYLHRLINQLRIEPGPGGEVAEAGSVKPEAEEQDHTEVSKSAARLM